MLGHPIRSRTSSTQVARPSGLLGRSSASRKASRNGVLGITPYSAVRKHYTLQIDRRPPRPLQHQALRQEHLDQGLMRHIALVRQHLEILDHGNGDRSDVGWRDGLRCTSFLHFPDSLVRWLATVDACSALQPYCAATNVTHTGDITATFSPVAASRPFRGSTRNTTTVFEFWLAANRYAPAGSSAKLRGSLPSVGTSSIDVSIPLAGSMAYTAMLSWPRLEP